MSSARSPGADIVAIVAVFVGQVRRSGSGAGGRDRSTPGSMNADRQHRCRGSCLDCQGLARPRRRVSGRQIQSGTCCRGQGIETRRISPPNSRDSSRLIAKPSPFRRTCTARASIRLLKRLEDDLLFVGRNADARVGYREADGISSVEILVIRGPAAVMGSTSSVTSPLCVNLNAFEAGS